MRTTSDVEGEVENPFDQVNAKVHDLVDEGVVDSEIHEQPTSEPGRSLAVTPVLLDAQVEIQFQDIEEDAGPTPNPAVARLVAALGLWGVVY